MQQLVVATFNQWAQHASDCKSQRYAVGRVVGRMRLASAGRALMSWQMHVAELRLRKRVVLTLLHRQLAGAVACWSGLCVEVQSQRLLLSRVMTKLVHRDLVCAVEVWSRLVSERKTNRTILARVVGRMTCAAVGKSFDVWWDWKRIRIVCRRVVSRAIQQLVLATFNRWTKYASGSKSQRLLEEQRVRRVVSKITQQLVVATFNQWAQHASDCKSQRYAVRRVVGRVRLARAGRALLSWQMHVAELRLRTRIVQKVLHRQLAGAFACWSGLCVEAQSQRLLLSRVMAKLVHRGLACALDGWARAVAEGKRSRARLARSWARRCMCRRKQLQSVFARWAMCSQFSAREKMLLDKLQSKIGRSLLGSVLRRWAQYVHRCKRQSAAVGFSLEQAKYVRLGTVFRGWVAVVCWSLVHKESVARDHAVTGAYEFVDQLHVQLRAEKEQARLSKQREDMWSTGLRRPGGQGCF
jgi:hypothetical protein